MWERRNPNASAIPGERRRQNDPLPNSVKVSVSDTGPGIPAEYHIEVFDDFFRLPQNEAQTEGMGLGLAIARRLVNRTIDRGTKSLRLAIAPSGYGNERSHQTTSMPGKRFGFTRSNPLDYDTVGRSSLLSRSILQQRHKSYRCCSRDPKIWPLGVVMFNYPHLFTRPRPRSRCFWLILSISIFSASGLAQTSATGAVIGIVLDPSGAVVPSALIRISKESGGASQSTSSDDNGRFAIQLLPPGTYQLQTSRTDFKTLLVSDLHIYVTEVLRLELHLQLAAHAESSQVFSNSEMLQTGSAGLGRIVRRCCQWLAIGHQELCANNRTLSRCQCRCLQRRRTRTRWDRFIADFVVE